MTFNGNYFLYENKILNDIERVCRATYSVVYNSFFGNMVLNFINRKTVRMSIMITNNNRVFLNIDGKEIVLTTPIALKCQQMMFEYKIKAADEAKKNKKDDYDGIIAIEQTRDIYKFLPQHHENLLTNQKKTDIVIKNVKVKRMGYFARKNILPNIPHDCDAYIFKNIDNKWSIGYTVGPTHTCFDNVHRVNCPVDFNTPGGAWYMACALGFKNINIR